MVSVGAPPLAGLCSLGFASIPFRRRPVDSLRSPSPAAGCPVLGVVVFYEWGASPLEPVLTSVRIDGR